MALKQKSKKYLLVGDLSATNTTLAVFFDKKLFLKWHYQSQKITNFVQLLKELLLELKMKHSLDINEACFAIAGPILKKGCYGKLTNAQWDVDVKKIKKLTGLRSILLINDFEAVAYGITVSSKKLMRLVKVGKDVPKRTKTVLGAGTGLGKASLVWNETESCYLPQPSEGGHADLPIRNQQELELTKFIKKSNSTNNVTWEDVLSGRGLQNIYTFLEKKFPSTKISLEIKKQNYPPELISQYRHIDQLCKLTFQWFSRFYGRCAKNYALDCWSLGGVYIAGGIAAKNEDIFANRDFLEEFIDHQKMQPILANISVWRIINYDISLYGAAQAIQLRKKGAL